MQQDDLWYRNPMVWLAIAIPALTVAGCALTIILAISNPEVVLSTEGVDTSSALSPSR